jgi:methionyl aminopeptidase
MKPGMTFTIEPMINQGHPKTVVDKKDGWTARTSDRKLSAQFEHTVLVTSMGCEVLTDIHNEYPIT